MIYFLVSAALFLPLVGGMLYFMRDVTDSQIQEDAGLEPKARNLLERLTRSPGALANGTTFWQNRTDGTDALVEAGIRHDTDRLRLSQSKLENLQRGSLEHDTGTTFVDYQELKDATGLDDRFDFHLQLTPTGFERGVDPYGTRGLGDAHVAYVGNLIQDDDFSGQWEDFHPQAQEEIEALEALGLTYEGGKSGFSDEVFVPRHCDSGEQALQHGTVVGAADPIVKYDEPVGEVTPCGATDQYSYIEHFLEYFMEEDFRFDALVFGSGVDLGDWMDVAKAPQSASGNLDEHVFLDFVKQGGTIIFLDSDGGNGGDDFVTKCAAADSHCLFSETGDLEALKVPDTNNHILTAPNRIPSDLDQRTDPWKVWDDQTIPLNETHGFIPVTVDTPIWEVDQAGPPPVNYTNVHLGITTSDRYGDEGGTVILSNWDLTTVADDDMSRIFSNLLNYGLLRTAYLDYGPEVPDDRAVRAAATNSILELPNGEFIEVRLQMFIWRS